MTPNGIHVETGDSDGDRQNWNDCRIAVEGDNGASRADDVGFIARLIGRFISRQHIDADRVYVTGASNGGMMSLRLITEIGDRLAAAVVFIANQPQRTDCPEPRFAVPLMLLNGTDDPLIRWQGGPIRDKGPALMSTPDTLRYWLQVNHGSTQPGETLRLPDTNRRDDSHIERSIYPPLSGGQPLWFYKVVGGGHTMPSKRHRVPRIARWLVGNQNRDVEGAALAWDFLRRFRRQNPH